MDTHQNSGSAGRSAVHDQPIVFGRTGASRCDGAPLAEVLTQLEGQDGRHTSWSPSGGRGRREQLQLGEDVRDVGAAAVDLDGTLWTSVRHSGVRAPNLLVQAALPEPCESEA